MDEVAALDVLLLQLGHLGIVLRVGFSPVLSSLDHRLLVFVLLFLLFGSAISSEVGQGWMRRHSIFFPPSIFIACAQAAAGQSEANAGVPWVQL